MKNFGCSSKSESVGDCLILNPMKTPGQGNNVGGSNLNFSYLGMQQHKTHLSTKATGNGRGEDSPYFAWWHEYDRNPYDPLKIPSGVIQMGLAENQVKS